MGLSGAEKYFTWTSSLFLFCPWDDYFSTSFWISRGDGLLHGTEQLGDGYTVDENKVQAESKIVADQVTKDFICLKL